MKFIKLQRLKHIMISIWVHDRKLVNLMRMYIVFLYCFFFCISKFTLFSVEEKRNEDQEEMLYDHTSGSHSFSIFWRVIKVYPLQNILQTSCRDWTRSWFLFEYMVGERDYILNIFYTSDLSLGLSTYLTRFSVLRRKRNIKEKLTGNKRNENIY